MIMLNIVPINFQLAGLLAKLHCQWLTGSILVELGYFFLSLFYYRILVKENVISGYLAYYNKEPAGFITYTTNVQQMFRKPVRRYWLWLAGVILFTVIPRRRGIVSLFRVIRQAGREKKDNIPVATEILSFAVGPVYRSPEFVSQNKVKVSYELFYRTWQDLRRLNVPQVKVMVKEDNIPANVFYRNQKFGFVKKIYRFNQFQNIYTKSVA